MRNFHKISSGLNVLPLLHQVTRQPGLWNQDRLRKDYPGSPHVDVDDVLLRFNPPVASQGGIAALSLSLTSHLDDLEMAWRSPWHALPAARGFVFDLARLVEAERIGRVMITRLGAGGKITRHSDEGAYARYYDRYQLMLQSHRVVFRAGQEEVSPVTGELWWFDNLEEHEVENGGEEDRVVMIIDLRAAR